MNGVCKREAHRARLAVMPSQVCGEGRREPAGRPLAASGSLASPGPMRKRAWLLQADSDLGVKRPDIKRLASGSDRASWGQVMRSPGADHLRGPDSP